MGKTSFAEAREYFAEQIQALNEGGVDLIMLETFGYHGGDCTRPYRRRVRSTRHYRLSRRSQLMMMAIVWTVPAPEFSLPRLVEWRADVIGCNCSVGPVAMLVRLSACARDRSAAFRTA